MNNLKNNLSAGRQVIKQEAERRMLPFAIEFVKFLISFTIIIAVALFTLQVATAAM